MDAEALLGGALSGLGEGLIEFSRDAREAAKAALARQQQVADRMQTRDWQVEDRDFDANLRRSLKRSGGGGSASGTGLVENEDGTLTLAKGAPAATVNKWVEAQARARAAGRPGATWEDYMAVGGGSSSADPDRKASLLQGELSRLEELHKYDENPPSREQLMGEARRNVDQFYSPPTSSAPSAGGGLAPNTATTVTPPSQAVAALRADPSLADQFDAKYGPGSAARFLEQ